MIKIKNSYIRTSFLLVITFLLFLSQVLILTEAQSDIYINQIGHVNGAGYEVCINNDYAYVTSNDGLDIINVQDPFNPKKKIVLEIADGAFGIQVNDDLAFIAAGGNGLVIANISNPLDPFIIGQSSGHGVANSVFANENQAFLACYESGLKIFDTSDLANPTKIGEYLDTGRIDDVVVVEDIAFLANPHLGVEVINITLPSAPSRISTITTTSGATDLNIYENLLFVGCYTSGVWVIDVTSPENPALLGGNIDSDEGEAQGVAGNSTHLFVADNYGVEYKNISNLPTVSEVAEIREGIAAAHDIDFVDNFLFIAGGGLGKCLIVFEVSTEQETSSIGYSVGISVVIVVFSISSLLYFRNKKRKKLT